MGLGGSAIGIFREEIREDEAMRVEGRRGGEEMPSFRSLGAI